MFTLEHLFLLTTVCAVVLALMRSGLGGWELFALVASLIPCGIVAFHVSRFWRTSFVFTAVAVGGFGLLYGLVVTFVLIETAFYGDHNIAGYAFVTTISTLESVILAVNGRRSVSIVGKEIA